MQSEGTGSDNLKMQWTGKISNVAAIAGAVIVLIMGLIVCYDVFMRFVFGAPTTWVYEIAILFTMAAAFLPLGYIQKQNGHVRCDFITAQMQSRTRSFLELATLPVIMLFFGVFVWKGVTAMYASSKMGDVTQLLNIPLSLPLSVIPVGICILGFQFISYVRNDLFPGLRTPSSSSFLSPILSAVMFWCLLVLSIILMKPSLYTALVMLFFVLLFSGMPVAFALGLFGMIGLFNLMGESSLIQLPLVAYSSLNSFVMVALPLFILNSTILTEGRIGPRIFGFVDTLVRHLPGGLGIAVVIFCGLFAAMTGSSVAVAAAVSVIALPELRARGYSLRFSIGLLAAGGTLGILFPPSLPLLVYAGMTMESVGSLFMAGVIPGLLLMAMLVVYVVIVGLRNKNIKRENRASSREIWTAFKSSWGGLMVVVIIVGGIYSGAFTPCEAGGVSAIYSLVLCGLVYRSLSWSGVKKALMDATKIYAMILFIVVGANITSQYIAMSQIPQKLLATIVGLDLAPWAIILAINVFLILMGGPLEAISILVITLPILYPIITGIGLSGIWFAIIMMINMELALISPPEGLNLFILQNLTGCTAKDISIGVLPFLVILCVELILVSCFPSLAMWLPNLAAH
jgi:C4-dicarboxylate transporter DctM subunit